MSSVKILDETELWNYWKLLQQEHPECFWKQYNIMTVNVKNLLKVEKSFRELCSWGLICWGDGTPIDVPLEEETYGYSIVENQSLVVKWVR